MFHVSCVVMTVDVDSTYFFALSGHHDRMCKL